MPGKVAQHTSRVPGWLRVVLYVIAGLTGLHILAGLALFLMLGMGQLG